MGEIGVKLNPDGTEIKTWTATFTPDGGKSVSINHHDGRPENRVEDISRDDETFKRLRRMMPQVQGG